MTTMSGRYFRNLADLSKNALSYSSPSMTKSRPDPSRKLPSKFAAIPPISTVGSMPPAVSSHPARAVVVVLPCVPAMTMDRACHRKCSRMASGSERYRSLRSRTSSSSGFPREIALPTITMSRSAVMCAGS